MTRLDDYQDKYRHVAFERNESVLEVRLHTDGGPLVWSPAAHRELGDAFADIAADAETKVVILAGTGDSFIASMDTQAFINDAAPWDVIWWEGKRLLTNLIDIEVPVIGVINGPATVHSEIAVLSDIVLAADTTVFADAPHFAYGTVPGDGIHLVWQHLLGTNRGRYFLLTAQTLSARDALEFGVVNEVLPLAELLPRARVLANDLATRPLSVLRYTRTALTMQLRRLLLDGLSHGLALEGCGTMRR
ncbi:MAG: enoyl-CoA hydratase/isomerase family protein [Actinobacteria bacterium]|nr:MAG: enoyl-CoA hydratase/isomerase family protein [Actinomycetota bacterium]